jgi:protein-tyrosine kinase
MSRLFEQARKSANWGIPERADETLDVGRVLETLKQVDSEVPNVPASRFENARKVRLLTSSTTPLPLLSQPHVSQALAGEAYRGLRTRMMRLQAKRGLHSIIVSSALSGEGKTLTTLNLALSYAKLPEMSVLVVDGDLRLGGLSRLLGTPTGPGLAEVLKGSCQFEDAVVATDLPNLYAVSAGLLGKGSSAELYASTNWKEFIAWCGESFKVILVDSPAVLPLADFELMAAACDGVLIVVRALQTRREILSKVAAQLDPNKLLGIVYNAAENATPRSAYQYVSGEM